MSTNGNAAPASRLARKLTVFDAVIIGLGAMIGAVAYCNATSSAQLAALYPESGGAYVYGQKRLSHFWGYLAGWGFVVGKMASCAAMALTFASYAAPEFARPLAVTVVLALTGVNYFGIKKTVLLTQAIVVLVLLALVAVIIAV